MAVCLIVGHVLPVGGRLGCSGHVLLRAVSLPCNVVINGPYTYFIGQGPSSRGIPMGHTKDEYFALVTKADGKLYIYWDV